MRQYDFKQVFNNDNNNNKCYLKTRPIFCFSFNNTDSTGRFRNCCIVMCISAMDGFTSIFALGHDGSSEKIYSAYH